MSEANGVKAWLEASASGESEYEVAGMDARSEFGEEFDEDKYVVRGEEEREVTVSASDSGAVERALGEVARATQRKVVCGFHKHYARGRMLDVPRYSAVVMQPQRFFKLDAFVQLTSIEDNTLVEALSRGVVRTRVGAETGLGKTMKLPGLLASKCNLRVLQLELDDHMAKAAMASQKRQYKIPGGSAAWCRERKAFIAAMSYREFRGIAMSGNRDRLFEDFDVIYCDEAHEPLAEVWVAKHIFATYAKPHNSLLVVSATVSTNVDNNVLARGVGRFQTSSEPMSLTEVLDGGELMTTHLRDRVMFLVASDEDAALARSYYAENGCEVFVLDSASTAADLSVVATGLEAATAVVPRVLVATQEYGTSYNFPVSYVISMCTRRVYEMNSSNVLEERVVPLMARSVVQHQGRVGRRMATGGGGWLVSPEVSPDRELLTSEALEAYLSLVAVGITPRPGAFDSVTKVLPKGVDPTVARLILRVGLPPALVVRYLGRDGLIASKFTAAVSLFAEAGEVFRKSKDEVPLGYESWISEQVGNYYVGDDSKAKVAVRVPFASPSGLRVVMHAISAVSEGLLEMEYWNWYDAEVESDEEDVGVRQRVRRVAKPRMPEAPVLGVAVSESPSEDTAWSYNADPSQAAKRIKRRGMSWDANGDGGVAMRSLMRALEENKLGESVAQSVLDVPEHGGKVAFALPEDESSHVQITSPGGGKILLVVRDVHDAFMSGVSLSVLDARSLVANLVEIRAIERFAKSTVFDNWSPAWLCWFRTAADASVVESWKSNGLHSKALRLLNCLYDRFRAEVIGVASSSNLYKNSLGSFFRTKPSVTRMVAAAKRGRLPVAQSDRFVARVLEIKDCYDVALLAVEESGVFDPGQVTKAQRHLPLRDGRRGLQVIDEDVVETRGPRSFPDGVSSSWRK